MWTVNFQMFKLVLEKAEEPDIKLPASAGSSKKQEISQNTFDFCFIDYAKAFDCVDHNVCEVSQLCPTLCDPMDCSLPGSSIHGIFQARILEQVAISFSRRSFWPRNWTRVSHIVGRCFIVWATGEAQQ